jgi:prephenate dehydrogenase
VKIAIVGGAGKMGRRLAIELIRRGQKVILVDCDKTSLQDAGRRLGVQCSECTEDAAYAGAVILAVPIDRFEETASALAPFMPGGRIIFDITSVKAMPVRVMHRYFPDCLVLGTHPVFGPGVESISGYNMVLTPTNPAESELAGKIKLMLEKEGVSVSLMTPEKHDELMAAVLGLAHYIALVSGDTLAGLGSLKELMKVSGPTFRALISFIESVAHEDPFLYAAIQLNIDALPDLQSSFINKAIEWAELVKNKNAGGFAIRMADLSERLRQLD